MKKILISLIFTFSIISTLSANYDSESIKSFINSPSLVEINKIEDKKIQLCERIFLEAYMRREFSKNENLLCSDIFESKIEAQMNYMRFVMSERGIY